MASAKHFLQFKDLSRGELDYLFARARILKARHQTGTLYQPLKGKTLAMIFEKNSTRTRVAFEAGMAQLGGTAIYLHSRDTQLGRGEPIEDVAQVMSRMVDLVMIRTYEQAIIERFASHSKVPVINGLTNEYHPCQTLADVFTYMEHRGSIHGATVAWIGDANNVCNSWLQAAHMLGFRLRIAGPADFAPKLGPADHACARYYSDAMEAVSGADLVTTDVWTSMGFEEQLDQRKAAFSPYQVNAELMAAAKPGALFMHCLPAHRGEEVSAHVMESPNSVVWDEAENRMHTQKALMEYLILGEVKS
ncbi:MAG: ornithine carbamoyltransferase [Betaproteobacteria bacterium]|nr:ornithine carbamoyltransferase [Betaproteobacteria bacterium]